MEKIKNKRLDVEFIFFNTTGTPATGLKFFPFYELPAVQSHALLLRP